MADTDVDAFAEWVAALTWEWKQSHPLSDRRTYLTEMLSDPVRLVTVYSDITQGLLVLTGERCDGDARASARLADDSAQED